MYFTKAMQAVLTVIANHAHALSLREIAEKAKLDTNAADIALDRLVRGGFLVDEVAADSSGGAILYRFNTTVRAQRLLTRHKALPESVTP